MLLGTMLDPPDLRHCALGHTESVTVVTLSPRVRALGKEMVDLGQALGVVVVLVPAKLPNARR